MFALTSNSLFAIISFQTITSEQMEPRSGLCVWCFSIRHNMQLLMEEL